MNKINAEIVVLGNKADVGAGRLGVIDAFLAAKVGEFGEAAAWLDVIEDGVDGVFTGHVFNLSSAEVKLLAQRLTFLAL